MHMLTVAYQYIEFVKHIILTFGIEYCIIMDPRSLSHYNKSAQHRKVPIYPQPH